jgi:osmotically-inducible protein OsmY
MGQSTALMVLPCGRPEGEARDTGQTAALRAAQGLADLCLAERVERALRATGHPCLRAIEVTVCGRLVVLRGRVPSYYVKQLAQAAALTVDGAPELRNDIEVVRP